jgi:chromosomal replication initiator protein
LAQADEIALTFKVPNSIYKFWIESNFLTVLKGAAASVLTSPREIRFVVADSEITSPVFKVHAEPAAEPLAPISHDENPESNIKHAMNPRYKFEGFVVGPSNEFAHAAAQEVSRSPAQIYNPLFIYGGVGLGKTHLMQAIGQRTIEKRKVHQKVMYLSSERFTNEFIDAIQQNMLVRFRKRYRQADVLLIDDIHFFAGKERSQEEFFHTFDTLFDGRKQIVLSSDRPPSEIGNLEQRLVSRLDSGLTTELQPPDASSRAWRRSFYFYRAACPDQRSTPRRRIDAGCRISIADWPGSFPRNDGTTSSGYSSGRSRKDANHRSNSKEGGRAF